MESVQNVLNVGLFKRNASVHFYILHISILANFQVFYYFCRDE